MAPRKSRRLLVGKKHCLKLCDYLPSNYKKAIQKLRDLTDLSEEDVELKLNPTEGQPIDLVAVNQHNIRHLQMNQSHTDLLAVCREMSVNDLHCELTSNMEEENKKLKEKLKEKELDNVVALSQQGSTNAGEKSPQSSKVDDNEVSTTTATTPATVVTTAISATASAAGSSVSSGAEATASVVDNPTKLLTLIKLQTPEDQKVLKSRREEQRKAKRVFEESMREKKENNENLQAFMSQEMEKLQEGNEAIPQKHNKVSLLPPKIGKLEEELEEFSFNEMSGDLLDILSMEAIETRGASDDLINDLKILGERAIQECDQLYKFEELQESAKRLHEFEERLLESSKREESGRISRWVWRSSLSERRGAVAVDIVGALLAKAIKSNSLSYKKPSEGSIEIVVALIVKEVVSGEVPTLQSMYAEKVVIEVPLYQGYSSDIEVIVYEAIKQVARELPLYQGHSSNIEAVLYEAIVHLPEVNTTPSYTIIVSLNRRYSVDNGNYVTDVANKLFTLTGRSEVESQEKELFEGLLPSTL